MVPSYWYHEHFVLEQHQEEISGDFDSGNSEEQGFIVHKADGSKGVFSPSSKGLCYSDVANNVGAIMVNTVDSNKSKYSI